MEPSERPEAADHGIGCERCHGPGGAHLQAVESQFPDLAIARPRLAPADQVVALCGQCHESPDSRSPGGPASIRFQTPNLIRSRCYTESGSLSCVTCHNPHKNASRIASDYERVCAKCHPPAHPEPSRAKESDPPLPVWSACSAGERRDCLRCHMPRVTNAAARTTFTDHYIRILSGSGRTTDSSR